MPVENTFPKFSQWFEQREKPVERMEKLLDKVGKKHKKIPNVDKRISKIVKATFNTLDKKHQKSK